MIEVGDMILYEDTCVDYSVDIGWVVHTEKHKRSDGLANLIYIKWLVEDSTDSMWQHCLDIHSEFTLVKGGQHD
jgi:hypothetical protein